MNKPAKKDKKAKSKPKVALNFFDWPVTKNPRVNVGLR
jgi:hypothetical protein